MPCGTYILVIYIKVHVPLAFQATSQLHLPSLLPTAFKSSCSYRALGRCSNLPDVLWLQLEVFFPQYLYQLFSCYCGKKKKNSPRRNHWREEGFIPLHSLRRYTPSQGQRHDDRNCKWRGHIVPIPFRAECEQEMGPGCTPSSLASNDLLCRWCLAS